MGFFSSITVILNVLDLIHDSLDPFFGNNKKCTDHDLDLIIEKLEKIENEVKEIKNKKSK